MEKTILVADDYEFDANQLQYLLRRAGVQHRVFVVTSGAQAMDYFDGKGEYSDRSKFPLPTVLFLDSKMPGTGGFEVLTWLRRKRDFNDTLVVLLTGFHERLGDAALAYQMGANSFITKPCQLEQIKALIKGFPDRW